MSRSQAPVVVELPASVPRRRGRWLYPFLLALQTAGAAVLCLQVLPIYRKALADPKTYDAESTESVLVAAAVILIGYWLAHRIHPEMPRFASPLLGHILMFAARLLFLLPTAIFSFLFIAKALELPPWRYLVIFFGLFALYCFVREVERLGNSMLGARKRD